jgi:hypothetical protein
MRIGIRVGVCTIPLLLWLTLWAVPGTEAEPPEACRDLAARFAAAPEQLDLKALATLGTCLTTEIGERVGVTGPPAAPPPPQVGTPPPPAPQGEASPPASQPEISPPQARQYGQWPPPTPWTGSWPSPGPWESPSQR